MTNFFKHTGYAAMATLAISFMHTSAHAQFSTKGSTNPPAYNMTQSAPALGFKSGKSGYNNSSGNIGNNNNAYTSHNRGYPVCLAQANAAARKAQELACPGTVPTNSFEDLARLCRDAYLSPNGNGQMPTALNTIFQTHAKVCTGSRNPYNRNPFGGIF